MWYVCDCPGTRFVGWGVIVVPHIHSFRCFMLTIGDGGNGYAFISMNGTLNAR